MLHDIVFMEEMRTTWGNKKYPKLCFTIPLFYVNRFNPFDSVPVATLRFELSWYQKKMTMQNFSLNIEDHFAYSTKNFNFLQN